MKIKRETNSYKVIGIDPGIRNTGVAVLDYDAYGKRIVEYHHLIKNPQKVPYEEALVYIGDEINKIVDNLHRDFEYAQFVIAVESIFISRNLNSAINTGKVIGMIQYIAHTNELPFFEIHPSHVKSALGAGAKANKKEIIKRVEMLTGKVLDSHHIADAVGIALACHLQLRDKTRAIRKSEKAS